MVLSVAESAADGMAQACGTSRSETNIFSMPPTVFGSASTDISICGLRLQSIPVDHLLPFAAICLRLTCREALTTGESRIENSRPHGHGSCSWLSDQPP